MRTNNIIPILLATAIHLIPIGIFLLKKPAEEIKSEVMPVGIGLSNFSTLQKKAAKPIKSVGLLSDSAAPSDSSKSAVVPSNASATGNTNSGGGDGKLSFLNYSEPVYPPIARANGAEGTVKIKVYYDDSGNVSSVLIINSSGHKMLDESVKRSAASWKLSSGTSGNFEKTFSFKLNN